MQAVLRHCDHCHLYFESATHCPVCGRDTAEPRLRDPATPERRKTTEVPRQPPAAK
jgi:rRNA maturation protein Nop10